MRHLDNMLDQLSQTSGLTETQSALVMVIGSVACVFWIYVYITSIWISRRDQTSCIPTFAICLNFTWELLASTVFEGLTPIGIWLVLERLWLVFDVIILYQLFRYGKNQATLPSVKRNYWIFIVGALIIGLLGHYTFKLFCVEEPIMLPDALVINLAMSLLFVQMFFQRPTGVGVSRSIAWCKMLGTQCNTVCMIWFVPAFYADQTNMWPFMWFLAITCGVIDCLYIYLVHRGYPAVAELPA